MTGLKKVRSFEQNIHVCRGIAIIMIIGAHTIPTLDWSENPKLGLFLDAVCNQASIIFFFIAGYLFQYLSPKFEAKAYYISKLKNVILPYLALSIPAIFIYTQLTERSGLYTGFYDEHLAYKIFFFLITGKHLAPLWFVPTIFLFYIAAPLLIRLDRYKAFYFSLPVLFVISLILGRDGIYGPINKAIYLVPAYFTGMAFSHYSEYWYNQIQKNWKILLLAALGLMILLLMDLSNPPHLQILFKILVAVLLVSGLRHYPDLFGNRLDYIAHISFGLFFIHAYVIGFLRVAYAYASTGLVTLSHDIGLIPGNLVSFILYHLTVTGLSILIIRMTQKRFGQRSRMLIGA